MVKFTIALILFIVFMLGIFLFEIGMTSYTEKKAKFLLINAKNVNTIEQTVRRAVKTYPDRKIYIFNRSQNPEMEKILNLLSNEFECVYIIHS